MEPHDFDKFIKDKLQPGNVYQHESGQAKPFIWSAVQNNLKSSSLTWRHLAAAMVLLLAGFSLAFYLNERSHQQELKLLSQKISKIQNNYQSELVLLQLKEAQVDSLAHELRNVAPPFINLPQTERVIYKTDTVFVKQTEFISTVSTPDTANALPDIEKPSEPDPTTTTQESEIDDMIYLHYSDQHLKQKPETIRFKLGSFTARKD